MQNVAIMPRDSLAEIMAAEQVLAAKQQLRACSPAGRVDSTVRYSPGTAHLRLLLPASQLMKGDELLLCVASFNSSNCSRCNTSCDLYSDVYTYTYSACCAACASCCKQ